MTLTVTFSNITVPLLSSTEALRALFDSCVFLCVYVPSVRRLLDLCKLQFYDGVVLILLMGLLDNYYIPLSEYYTSPHGFDQQVSYLHLSQLWLCVQTSITQMIDYAYTLLY